MRTGVESAITRLMGTRSGARVVKGRERDHATRLDSSKNGVTRKSMLVERTVGRRSEKRAVENRATKRSSPFARSPTTDPLSLPSLLHFFFHCSENTRAIHLASRERDMAATNKTKRSETKQNNSTTFFTILLSSSHSPNYMTHDRNNRSPSHGLISPNASHSNFLLVAITGQLASNAALLLDRFNAHQISTTTTTRVT